MPRRTPPTPPRGNWQRAHWNPADDPDPRASDAPPWRCAVCGAGPERAVHFRDSGAASSVEPRPYNRNQLTCGTDCARVRRNALQRDRRNAD